ncbi:MAG: PepSY domain-containing protein [Roseovarius sp.]
MTHNITKAIALGCAISLGSVAAYASNSSDDTVPDAATTAQITEVLAAQGYAVTEIEVEDDGYEAYAMKDGAKWEIELNADLAITEAELEDEDDD